jgi:hypothetical protein
MTKTKKVTATAEQNRKIEKVEDHGEGEKKLTFSDGNVEIVSNEDYEKLNK